MGTFMTGFHAPGTVLLRTSMFLPVFDFPLVQGLSRNRSAWTVSASSTQFITLSSGISSQLKSGLICLMERRRFLYSRTSPPKKAPVGARGPPSRN